MCMHWISINFVDVHISALLILCVLHNVIYMYVHVYETVMTLKVYHLNRCESYNSLIRARNIFANRVASSREIAQGFAILEHFRFICSGGSLDGVST